LCRICDGQGGTGEGFSVNTSLFNVIYHFTNVSYYLLFKAGKTDPFEATVPRDFSLVPLLLILV
jgi:hypothetical protein